MRIVVFMIALTAGAAAPGIIHAQTAARTFLASTGSDANPCSAAAPCRTLQRAITVVAPGGDVIILDSGGYGENIMIAKSVSVIAQPGVVARLRVSSDSVAATINSADINVVFDGVGISGTAGGTGILFLNGASLTLRNMDININYASGTGSVALGVSHAAPDGHLTMQNVSISNAFYGVAVGARTTAARATIVNSHVENFYIGFLARSSSLVSIKQSTATGRSRTESGCTAGFATDAQGKMSLDDVVSSHCYRGLLSGFLAGSSSASMTVSNALLSGNDVAGEVSNGATGKTFGNNRLSNNGTDTLTGFTPVMGQ